MESSRLRIAVLMTTSGTSHLQEHGGALSSEWMVPEW